MTTATTYLAADRGADYGASRTVDKPPGTGEVSECCGNHRQRCRFGRPHTWTTWYYQGRLVRTSATYACDCGAVCTGEEDATQTLCPEHSYAHGGKPAHLGDPSACTVCRALGARK